MMMSSRFCLDKLRIIALSFECFSHRTPTTSFVKIHTCRVGRCRGRPPRLRPLHLLNRNVWGFEPKTLRSEKLDAAGRPPIRSRWKTDANHFLAFFEIRVRNFFCRLLDHHRDQVRASDGEFSVAP